MALMVAGSRLFGRALLDLRGGTLVLSNLRIRADERSSVESLIRVEDGDLVLGRCQLAAPPGSEIKTRRLVDLRLPAPDPARIIVSGALHHGG